MMRLVLTWLAPLIVGMVLPQIAMADDRPNIILVLGDDMGFADIGPFGSEIETPALDALARDAIKFVNFRATPVCSVTRAELLTGANNIQVGLAAFDYAVYPDAQGKPGYEGYLTDNAVTIAQLLQDAGYNTYTSGKWHLGHPTRNTGRGPNAWGFDRSYGIYVGGSNHWNQQVMLPDSKDPATAEAIKEGRIPKVSLEEFQEDGTLVTRPDGVYSNSLYTSKMIEFLESGRDSGKPFFAYMAFTTAHFPIQAPEELINKYYDMYLELGYEGLREQRYESLVKHGIISRSAKYHDGKDDNSDNLVVPWSSLSPENQKIQARIMATYAAMIDSQDQHIKMLFDYLDSIGELDNTLIIYMTDNGPEGTDFRGKLSNPLLNKWVLANFDQSLDAIGSADALWQIGSTWANATTGVLSFWKAYVSEGGVRVPIMVKPPEGFEFAGAGEATNAVMSVKDVPMTILDYAGVEASGKRYQSPGMVTPSGVSMRPFLEGKQDFVRGEDQWVAFELFGNTYVIQGNYKATRIRTGMFGDGEWHLYDIVADPGETTPLENDQPKKLEELKRLYGTYAEQMGVVTVAEDWNPWTVVGK
ncbi:MAG: arylsulfatase [Ruegeria sp.]